MSFSFRHPAAELEFWRGLVAPLLARQPTPFYLCSCVPVERRLEELAFHFGNLPARHWLSFKTQPLPPLLHWWRARGLPVEVVSEFELLAALREGFPPGEVLVNGPAKHTWLPRHELPGLRVNLDSPAEARVLAPQAKRLGWTLGVRLNVDEEFDPQQPDQPTQFGLSAPELEVVLNELRAAGLWPEIVQCHLRSNVASHVNYERALGQVAEMCNLVGLEPRVLDCGGGFPATGVCSRSGKPVDAEFSVSATARMHCRMLRAFPSVRELWLENGHWLTGPSGVLVVQVLDVKERRGMRSLICDGGRANQALMSTWEQHELLCLPPRVGELCLTTVNGPTCMAFDQLARRPLPRDLQPGDHLIWLDAGAYHLPWETRFSHGLATVLWHDGEGVSVVREREQFEAWWGRWR
jgi:diaminopimelate decarboxylase